MGAEVQARQLQGSPHLPDLLRQADENAEAARVYVAGAGKVDQELAATAAVRVPINEASAKIRTGPAIDDDSDLDSDVWAGVIPLETMVGEPVPNPDLKSGVDVPDYIKRYGR